MIYMDKLTVLQACENFPLRRKVLANRGNESDFMPPILENVL